MTHRRLEASSIIVGFILIVLSALFILPLFITLSMSVSTSDGLARFGVGLLPRGLTMQAYSYLLKDPRIFRYYLNTIIYAAAGTLIMLLATSMLAYTMTFTWFSGKKVIATLLIITFFFSGGLIPLYLLIKNLGMYNTLWAMVLPNAIGAWNVIVFRTFFATIPDSLRESAFIDGSSYAKTLFVIVLPLSKPLLATFALFSVVGFWNSFFNALVFLRDEQKYPIAMLLRKMVVLMDVRDSMNRAIAITVMNINTRTVKSAAVIITILPIVFVYPFLQKYFTKGFLIGSIKG